MMIKSILVVMISSIVVICHADEDVCSIPGQNNCMDPKQPNFIIILADDLGYGDLSIYGNPTQEWGSIDDLASGGIRFTQAYSGDSVCSPSRAALLTGRLPIRSGIVGGYRVLVPEDTGGLPRSEITIAEKLRELGYFTGMVGKWHLGINKDNSSDGYHLPINHGFDYVGVNLPFTNVWECDNEKIFQQNGSDPSECFLYNGSDIVQQPFTHINLTDMLLDGFHGFLAKVTKQKNESVQKKKQKPFFFFLSFPNVHTDLNTANRFRGQSKRGLFGDNLNDMSWAVGEVKRALIAENLHENTLVIFLSDHGPHREICLAGGTTGGLKGGKANTFEGGFRIPMIAWWPNVIPAGKVSSTVISALDLFPTLISLGGGANTTMPNILDGIDISNVLLDTHSIGSSWIEQGSSSNKFDSVEEDRLIFFYCNRSLLAVRYQQYKIHFWTLPLATDNETLLDCPEGMPLRNWYASFSCTDESVIPEDPPLVYNLNRDPNELYQLNTTNPVIIEILKTVQNLIELHRKSLEAVPDQLGHYSDKVKPCCNPPKCICPVP